MASGVTTWISRFRRGDSAAASRLLSFYEDRISRYVRRKLQRVPQRLKDESDIKLETWLACLSLLRTGKQAERECNRKGLWALLKLSASHRVVDYVRLLQRKGEVIGRQTAFPVIAGDVDFDQMPERAPSAETELIMAEEIQVFVDRLDEDLRATARLKLEGLTVPAIAGQLATSRSSIERRLRLIRDLWKENTSDD